MKKFIFISFVVLATVQVIPTTEAFIIKTVTFQKGFSSPPSSEAAAAAFTASKNALVKTVSNAVTENINTFAEFVNSLVQLKAKTTQDLWRSTVNTSTGVINSVNGIIAAKPTAFTKTISVGFKPLFTTSIIPATTTVASGDLTTATTTTTTNGQSNSAVYYRRRF